MSRDLTCNESLAEDGGGTGSNFSPNQNRFNQTSQQLFLTANSAQSFALIRDQLLQQRQSSQLASTLLRAQQALGTDSLSSSITSNPTSISDNSLSLIRDQLLQQQNQQRQAAQLSVILSNLYGSNQLSSNASALNNTGLTLQQLVSALGLQTPVAQQQGVSGVQNDYETLLNQLLHQVQAQQQHSAIANVQALQSQTANRTPSSASIEQQLLSRILNSTRNVGGINNTHLNLQHQLNEILQSPQLLQVASELTKQHSTPQTQYSKPELRQTASYAGSTQPSDMVQQYIQRLAAQCGVSSQPDDQFGGQQATGQSTQPSVPTSIHQTSLASQIQQLAGGTQLPTQQSLVSQTNSLLNNLQNATYLLQKESPSTQHQIQNDQQLNVIRGGSGASPRILKRSRPSSSTPFAGSASHQRQLSDYSIEELKQKQSELIKNSLLLEGASSTQQQQDLFLEEYKRIQRLIEAKTHQSQERNGGVTYASSQGARLNEEQVLQERLLNASNSHRYNLDNPQSQLNDSRFITNIPTLAAFRQVPGQEIFEHLPKKRIKQENQEDKTITPLGVQRKQIRPSEPQFLYNKKTPQKTTTCVSKKFQNGSNSSPHLNFRDEPIVIDEDFENLGQRHNVILPRKRGRPRTTVSNERAPKMPLSLSGDHYQKQQAVSPGRTILHEAVDIFLKPIDSSSNDRSVGSPVVVSRRRINRKSRENEQLLSKINSLATAVTMTSPQDSDLLSPSDRLPSPEKEASKSKKTAKIKFDINSPETQQSIKEFREKHPELSEITDLEVCAIQTIIESNQSVNSVNFQKNKAVMTNFVANSLPKGPNFWNILNRIPQKMIPNELKVVDHVFNQEHLLNLAKVDMLTNYVKNNLKPSRYRPLFRDFANANERKNLKLMAMNMSFAQRRMDFVREFIYQSTLVRLLNADYRKLREDRYPQELFIDEPAVYNRINKHYGHTPPDCSRVLNSAEVECKLLNQMYRYRSQFFNEVHNRPFALLPRKGPTPDEIIILNMDVTKTLFNVVDSVSTGTPYVSFAQETRTLVESVYPSTEDFERLAFKTCEPSNSKQTYDPNEKTTVILGARQSSNELEDLKHKLQTHLNTNFRELLRIHDIVYKIRCRAVELHRDDLNHFISSVQRSISTRFGRRCSSVGPMMHTSDAPLPLYTRRRSRSLDVGTRSRVVNSVGVRYVQCPSLSDQDYVEAMKKQDGPTAEEKVAFGPKEYHDLWDNGGFASLTEHFEALLSERQQIIAALIKLSLTDEDTRAIIEAAREQNVAVDTDEFKVNGPTSRKNRLKSGISIAQRIRQHPHLHRIQLIRGFKRQRRVNIPPIKKRDFNWWYTQMLNGNLDITRASESNNQQAVKNEKQRLKERIGFVNMCKRMQTDGMLPYTPSLYVRDKNFILETLSERAFNTELNFRHLKCIALKFYAIFDSERHAQFIQKLERLEAPRLDVVLKMRSDLTIGYLYEPSSLTTETVDSSYVIPRHKGSNTIKVTPSPDLFDDMFGAKSKNPYRQPLLFPVTTSQLEINSAQLTKYRNREMDATPAERLNNSMNLTDCARALMRLIYQSAKYGNDLAIFMSHPAFKILEAEHGDQNGFPSTLYQVAIGKAIEQKKPPVERRKMPDFKSDEEAEQYFKERQKAIKEKIASVLTIAHKYTVLSRRCVKTMKKLSGIEKIQNAKIAIVRQHYNSLSSRSKSQFVKRFRIQRFNESTQIETDVRPEDNLKASLVIPGFDPPDVIPESSLKLPSYVRNDIINPPRMQFSTTDDLRSSMRGGKMNRGRGGRRNRRAARY